MTTEKIYKLAVNLALKTDLKSKKGLNQLSRDCPYPDSRILYAKPKRKIRKIAAAIDISSFDIYFAKKNLGCDLIISHHPLSKAANSMPDVLKQQIANLSYYGVSEKSIEKPIQASANKSKRQSAADNFYREEQLARRLNIDLMTLHTVTDNAAVFILNELFLKENCRTLKNSLDALMQLDEFQLASSYCQPPFIAIGKPEDPLGKISFSEFVGGEEASKKIFREMKKAGVNTILVPHLSEEFFESACRAGLKVIYCGHLASDSLGLNYFLDKFVEKENIEIIPLGGLLRE